MHGNKVVKQYTALMAKVIKLRLRFEITFNIETRNFGFKLIIKIKIWI